MRGGYEQLFFKKKRIITNFKKGCNSYFLACVIISEIDIFLNKQTFYMHIIIMRIKIHQNN